MVSSLLDKAEIHGKSEKSQAIPDYNLTKIGIDTADKMWVAYTVSRITRHWPLAIFYTIMNIAGINSQAMFLLNYVHEESDQSITFLKAFSKSLTEDHLLPRVQISSFPGNVSAFLDTYHSTEDLVAEISNKFIPPQKRRSCFMCFHKKNEVYQQWSAKNALDLFANGIQENKFCALYMKQIVKRKHLTNFLSPKVHYNSLVAIFFCCTSNSFSIAWRFIFNILLQNKCKSFAKYFYKFL